MRRAQLSQAQNRHENEKEKITRMPEICNMVPRNQSKERPPISQYLVNTFTWFSFQPPFLTYLPLLRSSLGEIGEPASNLQTRDRKLDTLGGAFRLNWSTPRRAWFHSSPSRGEKKISHRDNACVPWRSMVYWRREILEGSSLCSFFVGAVFVAILCSIHVEHVETIDWLRLLRSRLNRFLFRGVLYLWQGLSTLIRIPLNSHSLVHRSWHHTGSGKEGIMNRVEREERISILKGYVDDD